MYRRLRSLFAGLLLAAVLVQCSGKRDDDASTPEPAVPLTEEQQFERLVAAEEWILARTPVLKDLNASLKRLQLPDETSLALFADRMAWTDVQAPEKHDSLSGLPFVKKAICPAKPDMEESAVSVGMLWQSVLPGIARWESAKFYFIAAQPSNLANSKMLASMGFEGLAQLDNKGWRSFSGTQEVTWELGYDGTWRITRWDQGPLTLHDSPALLYAETLESSLAREEDVQRARHSYHAQNLVKLFAEGKFTTTDPVYARYQDLESSYQHPGLAVIDIDGDGWDELYVIGRWGKNQLLRRRESDGLYEDVAPAWGLDLEGYCNAAIFADFDNDGDPDAFIGRCLKRSLYLENTGGRFVDRSTEKVAVPLPYLVSSISAADYNNDGLLDVYLCLYGPTSKETPVSMWADEFFPPPMAAELKERAETSHRYLDMLGPPNLLLENKGGRFVVSQAAGIVAEWRNSYQSIWADDDDDGDVDLYVCNDFAPDALYRNDGGTFREVSREVAGNGMLGFGMGASWDDYDRDGKLDLYVSNMFSKAGRRITSQIEGLDERVPYSAQGSLLFRNEGGTFRQLAGTGKDDLHVAKVGWSFGGLFVDADNDGYPDIYSASGFYTAPEVTRSDQDL